MNPLILFGVLAASIGLLLGANEKRDAPLADDAPLVDGGETEPDSRDNGEDEFLDKQ